MTKLDRRLFAYRDDLADRRLSDQISADQFVDKEAAELSCLVPWGLAGLRPRPDETAGLDTQLMAGERLWVYERKDGWAWVQSQVDGYVGYLREDLLQAPSSDLAPSHWLTALRSPIQPEPTLKVPPLGYLHITSQVTLVSEKDGYGELASGGWVFLKHLRGIGDWQKDPVEVAQQFLGAPYIWAGRSSFGLDCSALVQLSHAACGLQLLRDSDQQAGDDSTGELLAADTSPQRGDLVYWKGHTAIALDERLVINATAFTRSVIIEPLADLDARARSEYPGGIQLLRRPQLG
ncbi:NlpC/P60 family protein [Rhodovibrionaceae bacterium A322]